MKVTEKTQTLVLIGSGEVSGTSADELSDSELQLTR